MKLALLSYEEMLIKETAKRFAESELMPRVQLIAAIAAIAALCVSLCDL